METIDVVPVTAANGRACAALRPAPGQDQFVSPVTYSLCVCSYGDIWSPWAITRGDVVGFAMTGTADDGSRWIGGLLVDAGAQRSGVERAAVTLLRDRLAAEPGCPNVALSETADGQRLWSASRATAIDAATRKSTRGSGTVTV